MPTNRIPVLSANQFNLAMLLTDMVREEVAAIPPEQQATILAALRAHPEMGRMRIRSALNGH